jgi:hypothetical protein
MSKVTDTANPTEIRFASNSGTVMVRRLHGGDVVLGLAAGRRLRKALDVEIKLTRMQLSDLADELTSLSGKGSDSE